MKNPFTAMFLRTSARSPVPETKSNAPLVALQLSGSASWTPRHYAALSREGYQKNPIAYRCIRMIAEAAASVRLKCEVKSAEHLLSCGHMGATITDILESFYGYLLVSGNAYLELGLVSGAPKALYALRPDRVSIKTSAEGWSCGYEYDAGTSRRQFRYDPATGRSAVFHMRLFHPLSDTLGFSPLEAAAQSVDIHNEGGRWTKALLDNSARPSGALIFRGSDDAPNLTDEQFDRLKSEIENTYSGAGHAGRPIVLEGGLDWKPMSLTPTDMDFLEARREAAREIALTLGVPPMLLGIPGDNTYANYKEANQAFWRQTIIPLVNKTARGLEVWLEPWFEESLCIRPDFDQVAALSEERTALWQRLSTATFLSDLERRTLAGLTSDEEHQS